MEKIGLFDILDKFGRTTNGKTDFASGKKRPPTRTGAQPIAILRCAIPKTAPRRSI